jgi:hypothetical protein
MEREKTKLRKNDVALKVQYGLGAEVGGRFVLDEISGLSARALILRVCARPQPPGPSARTAAVLSEVLRTSREIDAELTRASNRASEGQPISLDDVVFDGDQGGRNGVLGEVESDEVCVRISEAFTGGA